MLSTILDWKIAVDDSIRRSQGDIIHVPHTPKKDLPNWYRIGTLL